MLLLKSMYDFSLIFKCQQLIELINSFFKKIYIHHKQTRLKLTKKLNKETKKIFTLKTNKQLSQLDICLSPEVCCAAVAPNANATQRATSGFSYSACNI